MASRCLTEAVVRERLLQRPHVTLRAGVEVVGIEVERGAAPAVKAVRVQPRGGGAPSSIPADLVVDAGGRGSGAPGWLRDAGLGPPDETVVDSFSGYSTRWFQAPDPAAWPRRWWWKAAVVYADVFRLATVFPVEDRRWIVTLVGAARRYPPGDEAGFMATVAALPSPLIARMLELAAPISPVYGHLDTANRYRHYERWGERLDGFIAVGDACCALNPVYGHGMSAAVIQAEVLGECLAGHAHQAGPAGPATPGPGFVRAFASAQARALRPLWQAATGADFRFAETEGARPAGADLITRYFDAVALAAMDDPALRRTIDEVLNLLRPAEELFTPRVLAQVGRHALRSKLSRRGPGRAGSIPDLPL